MNNILKNIARAEVLSLKELVACADGQVVSKTLIQNNGVGITLFAFAKGEGISTHESKGDALVTALEGTGRITIAGENFTVKAGESIVMPANTPHAVYGEDDFKMLLVVAFPEGFKEE
ncbi:MAG: cupin domain-containing protein [Selenomonadaceae bacterium]|nr:cupin domain-containing protein [Selenomonadaceae bacterium]